MKEKRFLSDSLDCYSYARAIDSLDHALDAFDAMTERCESCIHDGNEIDCDHYEKHNPYSSCCSAYLPKQAPTAHDCNTCHYSTDDRTSCVRRAQDVHPHDTCGLWLPREEPIIAGEDDIPFDCAHCCHYVYPGNDWCDMHCSHVKPTHKCSYWEGKSMKVKEFLSDYSDHKISCLRYQTVAGAETSGYWKIGNRRVRFLRKPNGDYNIRCPQCGHWFYFGKKEQDFYARHGFDMPSRCHKCRGGQLGRI